MSSSTDRFAVILVIEDNPANLGVITRFLEDNGFEVMIARDGADGIEKAKGGSPDLILLDVMMPGIDGFETCSQLKNDPQTADVPVLFMTAMDSVADKVRGFAAGAVDYIVKPFEEREVIARINTHLKIKRLVKELEKQNSELQKALFEVKRLNGLLPICSNCKKIRDDKGYWNQLEAYIQERSEAQFSHSICEDCAKKLYPGLDIYDA